MRRFGLFLVLAVLTLFTGSPLVAQDGEPEGRVPIVQALSDAADLQADVAFNAVNFELAPLTITHKIHTLVFASAELPNKWIQYAGLRSRSREPKSKINTKGYAWLQKIVARTDTSTV